MKANPLIEQLWDEYIKITPSALKIHALIEESCGDNILNDHIAIRTFNHPSININRLILPFLEQGYKRKQSYFFDSKRLDACHLEHEVDLSAPKIFVSELRLQDMPSVIETSLTELVNSIDLDKHDATTLLTIGRPWGLPSYSKYIELCKVSEYAAWMYVFGIRANHFTIDVERMKSFRTLTAMNKFLLSHGFEMNTAGGLIKGSEAQLLEQSSTLADIIPIQFKEGVYRIPSCYYEFAYRYRQEGKRFEGFITSSANKIFESTDRKLSVR